ncbi:MAG: orotate phosphoribosyltransferase [Firmicutes bacterium]|nr:orotate phosphoribosyltransferase [Bacillota bacterium]
MTNQELLAVFARLGVLQTGHFELTSGLHSEQYMQCARLFEYPREASDVVEALQAQLPEGIETVIAPAIGGITVGYELARLLGCRFIFAERQENKMAFRRGFTLTVGERVLAVEDVVTTGGSVREVVELARVSGAEVLGVATIVDRSQGQADFGVPFYPLMSTEIRVFDPEQCPLCEAGVALQSPGSRKTDLR